MPSDRFFNLSAKKRSVLLHAARHEFARVPYAQTSINRIIQSAGISRGSFYTYFSDKQDLFCHMIQDLIDQIVALIKIRINQEDCDAFTLVTEIFDHIVGFCRQEENAYLSANVMEFVKSSQLFSPWNIRSQFTPLHTIIQRQLAGRHQWKLATEQDWQDAVALLAGTLRNALFSLFINHIDSATVRNSLLNQLRLVQDGLLYGPGSKQSVINSHETRGIE